ncbi:MAG: hypothetical protein D6160_08735 [Ketobacter sp.]|nr:MAG: hypothetical protein D6160_08735 [Ketobacter sp.]
MQNHRLNVMYTAMLVFLSLALFKVLMQMHDAGINALVHAAEGVIDGRPHWIAYQNRLLGPYLVKLISLVGFPFSEALKIFIFITVLIQNVLLFYLVMDMRIRPRESFLWVMVYSLFFIVVQHFWFYTWDSIDAIIFTLFAWGILKGQSTPYFFVLFSISILNRETALFIAAFVAIDAFRFESAAKFKLVSIKKLFAGISLSLLGAIYIKLVRHWLFISKADGDPDVDHELIGNHVYLIQNLKKLFYENFFSLDVLNSITLSFSVLYLVLNLKNYVEIKIKFALVYFLLVANILIFGLVNETRMYIILIPFWIFILISGKEKVIDRTNQLGRT